MIFEGQRLQAIDYTQQFFGMGTVLSVVKP